MAVAHELAQRIQGLAERDLGEEALFWSRLALLDTVGVALAGSREEAPRIVAETLWSGAPSGPSLVLGSSLRIAPLDAALVNGTAAHALDFDNTSNTMAGHSSAVMIPALIAAAEAFGANGRELLLAHAVGFETGARLGRGLNFHHHEKGWHPTSTLGVFAVAAACARLLHLSVEQTETALALATSLAAGTKANFGTMTKPLHAGQCARGGLMAVLLARRGFSAHPEAFEHKQGFFNVFNGPGAYDAARVLERWGEPLDIVAPGACYKQYPSCAGTHAAVEAALELRRRHGPFDPEAIERIETWTSARRLLHTDRPDPRSGLEAKFSVQYCVARALLEGRVALEHFEGDAWRDPALRRLLARVRSTTYDASRFPRELHDAAEVRVTLADGRSFSARIERALGRTTANPIPVERLEAKFRDCALRALARDQVEAALACVRSFETLDSVRRFTALLEPAAAGGRTEEAPRFRAAN